MKQKKSEKNKETSPIDFDINALDIKPVERKKEIDELLTLVTKFLEKDKQRAYKILNGIKDDELLPALVNKQLTSAQFYSEVRDNTVPLLIQYYLEEDFTNADKLEKVLNALSKGLKVLADTQSVLVGLKEKFTQQESGTLEQALLHYLENCDIAPETKTKILYSILEKS